MMTPKHLAQLGSILSGENATLAEEGQRIHHTLTLGEPPKIRKAVDRFLGGRACPIGQWIWINRNGRLEIQAPEKELCGHPRRLVRRALIRTAIQAAHKNIPTSRNVASELARLIQDPDLRATAASCQQNLADTGSTN